MKCYAAYNGEVFEYPNFPKRANLVKLVDRVTLGSIGCVEALEPFYFIRHFYSMDFSGVFAHRKEYHIGFKSDGQVVCEKIICT